MDLEDQIDEVTNKMVSTAMETGYFTHVQSHEPTSAQATTDLFAACWMQLLRPVAAASGLNNTSGLLMYNLRMYMRQMGEEGTPQDYIDPQMVRATARLMLLYSSRFTLSGLIRNVDLLGAHGEPLAAVAGYLTLGTVKYRVMTITIPMVINDLFTQAA